MQFEHVEPARIEREWSAIAEILAPAIERSAGKASLDGLRSLLLEGKRHLLRVDNDATGVVVLDLSEVGICWVEFVGGRIFGGPHKRLEVMRSGLSALENAARFADCKELRFSGRNWPFREYQAVPGGNNIHRKVL